MYFCNFKGTSNKQTRGAIYSCLEELGRFFTQFLFLDARVLVNLFRRGIETEPRKTYNYGGWG